MSLDVDVSELAQIPVFAGIPPEDLASLLRLADTMELGTEEVLFSEGEAADTFYVLLSGGIDLSSKQRFFAHVGAGAAIGETSLLTNSHHSASARATEPSRLLRFPDRRFNDMLDAGSVPAYRLVVNLARVLASRLRAADSQLAAIGSQPDAQPVPEDDLDRLRRIFFAEWGL